MYLPVPIYQVKRWLMTANRGRSFDQCGCVRRDKWGWGRSVSSSHYITSIRFNFRYIKQNRMKKGMYIIKNIIQSIIWFTVWILQGGSERPYCLNGWSLMLRVAAHPHGLPLSSRGGTVDSWNLRLWKVQDNAYLLVFSLEGV